jgi:hypothetical protein
LYIRQKRAVAALSTPSKNCLFHKARDWDDIGLPFSRDRRAGPP